MAPQIAGMQQHLSVLLILGLQCALVTISIKAYAEQRFVNRGCGMPVSGQAKFQNNDKIGVA